MYQYLVITAIIVIMVASITTGIDKLFEVYVSKKLNISQFVRKLVSIVTGTVVTSIILWIFGEML